MVEAVDSRKATKIALVGVCSKQNIGDAAIHVAAIRLLKSIFTDASISSHTLYAAPGMELYPELLSIEGGGSFFPSLLPSLRLTPRQQRIPRVTIIGYLIRAVLLLLLCRLLRHKAGLILTRPSEKKALKDIASSSLIVGAPGYRFSDTRGGLRGVINCFIELYPLILSGALKRRRIMMGVSIGHFRGRLCRWLVRRTLNRVERVFAREEETISYLVHCGVDPRIVELIPDLALSLVKQDPSAAAPDPSRTDGHSKIAVAIGTPPAANLRRPYYEAMSRLLDELIESKDAYLFMVPHTRETDDQSDDMVEIPLVLQRMKRQDRVTVLAYESPPNGIMDIYRSMDLVVTSRLHAIILSRPTPVVVIPTMAKYRLTGTMSYLGLSDYCIDTLNPEQLKRVVDEAWKQKAQIRLHQEEIMRQITGRFKWLGEEIKSMVS